MSNKLKIDTWNEYKEVFLIKCMGIEVSGSIITTDGDGPFLIQTIDFRIHTSVYEDCLNIRSNEITLHFDELEKFTIIIKEIEQLAKEQREGLTKSFNLEYVTYDANN